MADSMGISGRIAKAFLQTEITPLLALLGLLLGLFAILVTPREEEPQIDVTFANVFIPYPGASAREVEQMVTTSAEQVLSEIEGVKHIYSVSRPDMAVLTVQFEVGEARDPAIVRLYNTIFSNRDWLPPGTGVGEPLIRPMGIDDVPIVTLTMWHDHAARGAQDLLRVAHAIEAELKRVPGTRDIYTIGGPERVVRVQLDASRLSGYGLGIDEISQALQAANVSRQAGVLIDNNETISVRAGELLTSVSDVAQLVVGVHDGRPVYLQDVAAVSLGADQPEQYLWHGSGGQAASRLQPAVTLAVAKKPGTNAVSIARQVIERFEHIRGVYVPEGVQVTVTRNYGDTANAKAKTLIGKLIFATVAVVVLVLVTLGRREAIIVGVAIVITLAITLFASWAWGFTLNRVSLFALIFSIGILVDDAIVVVENIHRHMQKGGHSLVQAIPLAVDEVGGPTILATFTVIAALLPMAFVTGLMGPYMSPIPINASMGMLISLLVAFIVTPWLSLKFLRVAHHGGEQRSALDRWLDRFFHRYMTPFLGDAGRTRRRQMLVVVLVLIALSVSLVVVKAVVMKMLPFDNKSEFQVVVDMPESVPLEQTSRTLQAVAGRIARVPEVDNYQVYAGTASPINFNGLVRQYYLREGHNVGDIQVNLVDKAHRERQSHEVAGSLRADLAAIGKQFNANVKVVEVPPGPPVLSPLVAEIYGLNYQGQVDVARAVRAVFESTPDIVDVDDSVEQDARRYDVQVDRQRAAMLGISQRQISQHVTTLIQGYDVTYLHDDQAKYPVPVRLTLADTDKAQLQALLTTKLPARNGAMVALADLVQVTESKRELSIYHKDLLPVVFVTGDMAGELDSPLYGMFDMVGQLGENGQLAEVEQMFINAPDNPYRYSLKWDGEWQITYETFRDMGIAYAVGLVLIYLLVVAQFRSYLVPLIIMLPILLTVIGVLPGHALAGKHFTATSMIGMIALAGIIVRNSILLVDFINQELGRGVDFKEAVLQAGIVRTKPIMLTALAAMLGALFILDDPIFSGLAISLISGIFVSTLLTLFVIPVLYYALMAKRVQSGN